MEDATSPRDDNGRFATGNPGGPGRSKGRGYELQRAAQEAVSVEQVKALMRKALLLALQGNLGAMRFVMERTCGKPPELQSEATPLDISLPNLRTVADCTKAVDLIAAAVTAGTVNLASAKVLLDVVQARMKAIEVTDFEQRLAEVEKAAATVDLPGSRRRS